MKIFQVLVPFESIAQAPRFVEIFSKFTPLQRRRLHRPFLILTNIIG